MMAVTPNDGDDSDDQGEKKFMMFRRLTYRNAVLSVGSRLTSIPFFTL